jgi:hypothetical protein
VLDLWRDFLGQGSNFIGLGISPKDYPSGFCAVEIKHYILLRMLWFPRLWLWGYKHKNKRNKSPINF